jgi:RNA polymerase sigma factor (sigma-70 family)
MNEIENEVCLRRIIWLLCVQKDYFRTEEYKGFFIESSKTEPREKNSKLFCPLFSFSGSLIVKQMTDSPQQVLESELVSANQLLADYAATGSEMAFRELVGRYVDLVYSAAVRLVNADSHLAQDVTQIVFADLARKARSLSTGVMLGGWLHRHTVFVASKVMRTERRRQLRERQAVEMNSIEDHSAANLASLGPVLDEAINSLGAEDRAAIMFRYFEQRDFQSVGDAMGSSEDGARKRVDRALEKLEFMLKRRGVTLSAAALGTALGASAVSAAPAGLAVSISTVALASAAAGSGTLTILKIITMTKAKAAILGAVIVAAVATPLVISHQKEAAKLRTANEIASQQQTAEIQQLQEEKENLLQQVGRAKSSMDTKSTNDLSREVLRLRGEVGKLRQEKADLAASKTNGPSALSELRKNPEMWKMIREQQKTGLAYMYGDFAKNAKLPTDLRTNMVDTLADHIMNNVDRITEVLQDGKTGQEFENVFAAEELALQEKLKELLGAEKFSEYEDYTHNLLGHLTAEQFKGKMSGDKEAKEQKTKQLRELMQEETQAALAGAGLPPNYQTIPMLNFRNIASDAHGEKSLKLLDSIYEQVEARAKTFLSAEELASFVEFRGAAVNGNRMALLMNRKMMAPGSE